MIKLMNVSLSDHDRFVKDHKNSDMLQVSAWGKVKEDSGRDWEIKKQLKEISQYILGLLLCFWKQKMNTRDCWRPMDTSIGDIVLACRQICSQGMTCTY